VRGRVGRRIIDKVDVFEAAMEFWICVSGGVVSFNTAYYHT